MKRFLARAYRLLPVSFIRFGLYLLNPKLVVSTVGVFFDGQGRVLVLHHVFRHHHPWGLPAGFLSSSETPETGIARELKEETGLEASVEGTIGSMSLGSRRLEIALWGEIAGPCTPVVNHEIFEAVFADPSDLPAGMSESQISYVKQAVGLASRCRS